MAGYACTICLLCVAVQCTHRMRCCRFAGHALLLLLLLFRSLICNPALLAMHSPLL